MREIEQFAQSSILLIILTAAASLTAQNFSLLLLAGGIFMLFITHRSLSGELSGRALFLQLLLSMVFVLVSKNTAGYLIFFVFC